MRGRAALRIPPGSNLTGVAGRRGGEAGHRTGGFGVAAAAGGAACTVNVDNKQGHLAVAQNNYHLNALASDSRNFSKVDALLCLQRIAKSTTRYDLLVLDPPPRFSQKSAWAFEAERDYGRLLAECIPACARGGKALILAGLNALTVDNEKFAAFVGEAEQRSGAVIRVLEQVGAGNDYPHCPHRPTARFALLEVDHNGPEA
ncbi:hypothetical protein CYMTET_8155 [Cymbomonas tetramitiformis]|uniref:S-adenosylmethionine-dependent methyltransferase domain-containing protein n=1 Tax=Cymbomonas tetramitiformis TaxID=36881 RepID=A0AAE0GTL6_9CHLO|nr:hypothetical protein CYMTET_8155 [Cymbomonas tetramitiformis]KAK3284186.1 hypothetical protein CYMTET_8155 [Cymbomonas tetramitiformis]